MGKKARRDSDVSDDQGPKSKKSRIDSPTQQDIDFGSVDDFIPTFWKTQFASAESEELSFKRHALPLARIKKVMKTDPAVKMIAAEVPILFSKACDIFIAELAGRAWLVADGSQRKTMCRGDIASAAASHEMYDFLIDLLPRGQTAAQSPPVPAQPSRAKRLPRSARTTSGTCSYEEVEDEEEEDNPKQGSSRDLLAGPQFLPSDTQNLLGAPNETFSFDEIDGQWSFPIAEESLGPDTAG